MMGFIAGFIFCLALLALSGLLWIFIQATKAGIGAEEPFSVRIDVTLRVKEELELDD